MAVAKSISIAPVLSIFREIRTTVESGDSLQGCRRLALLNAVVLSPERSRRLDFERSPAPQTRTPARIRAEPACRNPGSHATPGNDWPFRVGWIFRLIELALTGCALRQDLQQRSRSDRDLPGKGPIVCENEQYRHGHPARKQPHCEGNGAPVVAVNHGDSEQHTNRLHQQAQPFG